jgi:uncharacterized protein YbjT (DUF2867 family)
VALQNQIGLSKPVMVTGASGCIASWIVHELLEAGVRVHATVRDQSRAESVATYSGTHSR